MSRRLKGKENGTISSADPHHLSRLLDDDCQRLLTFEEIPWYLQFNKYVLSGYRPILTFWGCIRSIFRLHNETVNIITHGIPGVVILASLPYILPWQQSSLHPIQLLIHAQALVSVWLGSLVYHTFMNHISGGITYDNLLKWDLVGVWFSNAIGSLNPIYASVYCLSTKSRWTIVGGFLLINSVMLFRLMKTKNLLERGISFVPAFLFRCLSLYHRFFSYAGGHDEAKWFMVYQEFWTAMGLIVGVLSVPERFSPGTFDYFFNSHNILHVLPVLGSYYMHRGIMLDFQWFESIKTGEVQCF